MFRSTYSFVVVVVEHMVLPVLNVSHTLFATEER
jgi:hypothetical protein